VQEEHLRARRLPHRQWPLAVRHVIVDLSDARALGLRQIGLGPCPFVGRKSVGQGSGVRLPDSTFYPWSPRQRGLHRLDQPLLQHVIDAARRAVPARHHECIALADVAAAARDRVLGTRDLRIGRLPIEREQHKAYGGGRHGEHQPEREQTRP
jgi:hypothetical protein